MQEFNEPIGDVDVTDAIEPQLLPSGVTLDFLIESAMFNSERKILNFKLAATSASLQEKCPDIDPTKPVARADWALFLPNRDLQEPDKYEASRVRLKQTKEKFSIPLPANLSKEQFVGRIVRGVTKERERTPEDLVRYGRSVDVDVIVEVLN